MSTPWYDDPIIIAEHLARSLTAFCVLVQERHNAGYVRRERLSEWCVLGRCILDACGNFTIITEGAPAESNKCHEVTAVMPAADVAKFSEHWTTTFRGPSPRGRACASVWTRPQTPRWIVASRLSASVCSSSTNSRGLPESALRAAGRHEEMKRFPLTLPQLGSTYPYSIDGHLELFTVDRIDLGQGLMYLSSAERSFERPTFINDVVRMVRPNNIEAWLPVLREQYAMGDEGRAALIAEANASPTDTELMEAVDAWHAAGENTDDLSHDLYATIGDPVPPLVWPRQESEQSPAHSETPDAIVMTRAEPGMPHVMRVENFNVGDRVIVVKKVETLSDDRSAGWESQWMDETVGETGHVKDVPNGRVLVQLDGDGCEWAYAPQALALENACSEVTKAPDAAPVVDDVPAKPRVFKAGDRVIVARKVERDSTGHYCFWVRDMDDSLSLQGEVTVHMQGDFGASVSVKVDSLDLLRWYSPEALDLIEPAP